MILDVRAIEESSKYQDIFAKGVAHGEAKARAKERVEGRVEAARLAILRLGRKKYGQPDESVYSTIGAIDDVEQLNSLLERILDAPSWDQLLTSPGLVPAATPSAADATNPS
jgi:predicted transposase YdaD